MPSGTRPPNQALRRDSWPPTQMLLHHSIELERTTIDVSHHEDPSLDDDPISFFLTPTPLLDDGDTDEDDDVDTDMDLDMDLDMDIDRDLEMNMAFDAGIEDPHYSQPTTRSISPSDITGPSKPPSKPSKAGALTIRSPTPPKYWSGTSTPPSRNSPEALTPTTEPDDDDDDEDYVRFTPRGMPLRLPSFNDYHNFASSKGKGKARKAAAAAKAKQQAIDQNDRVGMMMARGSTAADSLLSPPGPFHVGRPPLAPSTRGRPTTIGGRPPVLSHRPRSWSGATGYSSGRLSPRAWREPSPDVWSIEEEPEDDLAGDVGAVQVDAFPRRTAGAKAWKRVRFVLPVTEEIP